MSKTFSKYSVKQPFPLPPLKHANAKIFRGNKRYTKLWGKIIQRYENKKLQKRNNEIRRQGKPADGHLKTKMADKRNENYEVPDEVMELLPHAVKGVLSHYHPDILTTTTTQLPPVVWFPDLSQGNIPLHSLVTFSLSVYASRRLRKLLHQCLDAQ